MLAAPSLVGLLAIVTRYRELLTDRAAVEAGEIATITDVNAFEGLARALHPGLWVLSYVVIALASLSIAGEYSQGTLRNVLLRPITRVPVVLGKWFALVLVTLGAYALLLGVAIAAASIAFDWKGVVEILPNGVEYPHVSLEELWPVFWQSLAAPVLPLLAFCSIGLLVGAVTRRGATALASAIGIGLLFDLGRDSLINSSAELWSVATYMPSKIARTSSYIDHYLRIAQGNNDSLYLFSGPDIYAPTTWIIVTFGAAAWVLKKRYVP